MFVVVVCEVVGVVGPVVVGGPPVVGAAVAGGSVTVAASVVAGGTGVVASGRSAVLRRSDLTTMLTAIVPPATRAIAAATPS